MRIALFLLVALFASAQTTTESADIIRRRVFNSDPVVRRMLALSYFCGKSYGMVRAREIYTDQKAPMMPEECKPLQENAESVWKMVEEMR